MQSATSSSSGGGGGRDEQVASTASSAKRARTASHEQQQQQKGAQSDVHLAQFLATQRVSATCPVRNKTVSYSDFRVGDIGAAGSRFVRPKRLHFAQDGSQRAWDMVQGLDSVGVLALHTGRRSIVLVRQFRPAVWYSCALAQQQQQPQQQQAHPAKSSTNEQKSALGNGQLEHAPPGFTFELCAGLIDKAGKEPLVIAKEELLEECGFDVPLDKFRFIAESRGGVGLSGNKMHLFYVELDDSYKVSDGGGNPEEGEFIQLSYLPVSQIRSFVSDASFDKPSSLSFALMWFLVEKPDLIASQQ